MTYLEYINAVRNAAVKRLTAEEKEKAMSVHLVYGSGHGMAARGITMYSRWHCHDGACHAAATSQSAQAAQVDLVEICALAQESFWQIAGTTLHELGHVLAGTGTGHNAAWKEACGRLGLRRIKAAGTEYYPALFDISLRFEIAAIPLPTEGRPAVPQGFKGGSCSHGRGSRGGQSFGKGSGRMRKFTCKCTPAVIVRAARDELHAHCDDCGAAFTRDEDFKGGNAVQLLTALLGS